MRYPFKSLGLLLLGIALLCGGCGGEGGALPPETDDSGYRDAKQLENQGRMDEALASYLRVIARRGDSAPESHLDAGQIYLGYIKDPIFAIYHFRKYLELEPNSKQAQLVRGQIEAAKREFARRLPGQPQEDSSPRLESPDELDSLRRENQELKSELAALRASGSTPLTITHSSAEVNPTDQPAEQPAARPDDSNSPIKLAPMDQRTVPVVAQDDAADSQAPAPSGPPPRSASKPTPQGGRTHTVARGETLYGISVKYYGTGSKRKDIFNANRDIMSKETDLKPGMQIKIP